VADLRITDPALTAAQMTFRTAGNRLAPVVQALAELAEHSSQIDAAFTQADQQLSQAAGAAG
jgi:hypothetical protein